MWLGEALVPSYHHNSAYHNSNLNQHRNHNSSHQIHLPTKFYFLPVLATGALFSVLETTDNKKRCMVAERAVQPTP